MQVWKCDEEGGRKKGKERGLEGGREGKGREGERARVRKERKEVE